MTLLLVCLGGWAMHSVNAVSESVDLIYRHPLTVSNSARNIRTHFVSMHRSMKDVVLAQTAAEVDDAVREVELHEAAALEEFDLIEERFLGDPEDVLVAREHLLAWRASRDVIISLKRSGEAAQAAKITQTQDAVELARLEREIDTLIDFAANKATEFQESAATQRRTTRVGVAALLLGSVFCSFIIAWFVQKSMARTEREMAQRDHLIDQNILTARLDREGQVVSASSALSRALGTCADGVCTQRRFFYPPGSAQHQDVLRVAGTGERHVSELAWEHEHAELAWYQVTVIPRFDELFQITGFDQIFYDITYQKSAQRQSRTDQLTGLLNRRAFDETVAQEVSKARRMGTWLGLVILDVDHFKDYNDHYGHPAGDQVLERLAEALKASFTGDREHVFRVGGEEFGVLLQGRNASDCLELMEGLRHMVSALAIPHERSETSAVLTFSAGLRALRGREVRSAALLYEEADQALYQAKERRDSVVAWRHRAPVMLKAVG